MPYIPQGSIAPVTWQMLTAFVAHTGKRYGVPFVYTFVKLARKHNFIAVGVKHLQYFSKLLKPKII